MKKQPYYTNRELTDMIEPPNKEPCQRFYRENLVRLRSARGSLHNHHSWEGGYVDHMTEGKNICMALYNQLNALRPLQFTLSDALLSFDLHDIEKPWKYEQVNGVWRVIAAMDTKEKVTEFRKQKIAEYGFQLTDEHWNAIEYAEGENHNYTPGKRGMKPLAALVHMCDVWSARGWYDYPKEENDPWCWMERRR